MSADPSAAIVASAATTFASAILGALEPRRATVVCSVDAARAVARDEPAGIVLHVMLPNAPMDLVDDLRAGGDARPVLYVASPGLQHAELANHAVRQLAQVVVEIPGWERVVAAAVAGWPQATGLRRVPEPVELVRRRARAEACTGGELDVLALRAAGRSIAEIAALRGTRPSTVRTLGERAARRCGYRNVTELLHDWLARP